jgi:nitrogen regulatory protein P-II 1
VNKIEAIIRPEKLPSVRDALGRAGFRGMTIIHSAGRGDDSGVTRQTSRGTTTYVEHTSANVKLEMVVRDEDTETVLNTITDNAHTGNAGDGRIFVFPIAEAIRIDTRERGTTSL